MQETFCAFVPFVATYLVIGGLRQATRTFAYFSTFPYNNLPFDNPFP